MMILEKKMFLFKSFLIISVSVILCNGLQPNPLSLLSSGPPFRGIVHNFTTLDEAIKDGEKFIETLFHQMNLPSLVFGFAHGNETLYKNHWGFADLENRAQASIHSHYRLCSISKTFTSAMIGRLVDQGHIQYDTPVNKILKYLPEMKFKGHQETITVGQLLSHTAGTHVTDILKDFQNISQYHNASTVVRKFMNEPLLHKPGGQFNYSNAGFEMLASIVETVTKKRYPEALTEVLHLMNLHQTIPGIYGHLIDHRPRNYRRMNVANFTDDRLLPTSLYDEFFFSEGYFGSGGLLSTVDDLLHWGRLLLDAYHGRDNRLLSKETVRAMWSPHSPNLIENGNSIHYGYGFFICNLTAPSNQVLKYKNYVWHTGGLAGTSTILMIEPEAELVGVAMTNEGYILNLDSMVVYMAENIGQFL